VNKRIAVKVRRVPQVEASMSKMQACLESSFEDRFQLTRIEMLHVKPFNDIFTVK
jgi:hypothetical protein